MNRAQNLAASAVIRQAMDAFKPESETMNNLRRAFYLHSIIDAMLNEQVFVLPETCKSLL